MKLQAAAALRLFDKDPKEFQGFPPLVRKYSPRCQNPEQNTASLHRVRLGRSEKNTAHDRKWRLLSVQRGPWETLPSIQTGLEISSEGFGSNQAADAWLEVEELPSIWCH